MNVSYVGELFINLSSFHEATSASYVLLTVHKHMSAFSQPLQLSVMTYCAADFFSSILVTRL
jgi:hypothetical protein